MPKVQITSAKGLVQKTGTGIDVQNVISFSNSGNLRRPTATPADGTALDNEDSGKFIFLDASSANTLTLPAVATLSSGWHVRIILKTTGALGKVVTNSSENKIVGQIVSIDPDGSHKACTSDADADTISFVNTCKPGSYVDICTNGTLFYVHGVGGNTSNVTNLFTLTRASG
tara:strand:- start:718 stop:1233 length:516 start_codon:yes stop_codon:yes gene_type:complete